MGMKRTEQGEIALRYCREHPDKGTLTIAKLMFKENPGRWNTVEACRTLLRGYKGQLGKHNLKYLATTEAVTSSGDARRSSTDPSLPPSDVKILIYDLETSPINAYVWQCYKTNVAPQALMEQRATNSNDMPRA